MHNHLLLVYTKKGLCIECDLLVHLLVQLSVNIVGITCSVPKTKEAKMKQLP